MAVVLSVSCSVTSLQSLPQIGARPLSLQRRRHYQGLSITKSTFIWRIKCCSSSNSQNLRTCKNCKTQFNALLNHPRACCFHTAHFGGETKRKFESVYTGGTMNTPNSGEVVQYWHCCGSEDPFDPGCTSAPHASYDD